ncbi:hypothetical protein NDU88_005564 [Pleurodeles waltl]|uniref:Uncharacterized protein n=1 Tax=Pleurodeles waltl TaxID=8319 RepID=A0AAV7QIP1_PLEWA|nr:hypothetical protein NDU88_005564 [Pleurodeles waltl]
MILAISENMKKGFAISETSQGEIREPCEVLEKMFDLLTARTQALEATMGSMKEELRLHKEEIWVSKGNERELQIKLEQLENSSQRNNLRLLKVPEGVEWEDLKSFVVSLIKSAVMLEESKEEIERDIQRIHRHPFKSPNSCKPRKILINFQTYELKEKILSKALRLKTLRVEDASFEIRSDLSRSTIDKQWELGRCLDEFKSLGASAQLKFPAFL